MTDNLSNWDSYWEPESQRKFWQEPAGEILRLRDTLDGQKIHDVLDLGCGIGRHTILFAESGFNVTAVDGSKKALDILEKNAAEKKIHINCIRGSFTDDLFPEHSFDLVIAYNVLYHGYRDDFHRSAELIHKYLRPEGLFFFTCPTRRDSKYGNGEKTAENTCRPLNSVHPGDIHYFADEDDIAVFLSEFSCYTLDKEEHNWDNDGVMQFSSSWQVLARK